jgi:exonuclease SbcD
MKILHISDIHFGIETYSRIDQQTGLPTRLLDFRNAFDRAIDHAIDLGVDLVLFTGDAYKNRDPGSTVQREFAKCIKRLISAAIPVFLLTGNHDLPNTANRAHSIEIFETLAVSGVTVARKIDKFEIHTKSGVIQIIALPWLTRTSLLVRDEYKGRSMPELEELMLGKIQNQLLAQVSKLDPKIPAILAVHGTISGATFGSERTIMLGQDMIIQKGMLYGENFDYIAVGHIHKRQHMDINGVPIVYPGNIERIDFGEEKEEKGYVLLDIEDNGGGRLSRKVDWRYHTDWSIRPFRTVEIDLEDLKADDLLNPTSAAIQHLQRQVTRYEGGLREAIVRVRVKLRAEQEAALREDELRRALNEYGVYHVAAINREVDRQRRTRLAGLAVEELTPMQLLEAYLESKNTRDERKEILLKYAKLLIEGQGEE